MNYTILEYNFNNDCIDEFSSCIKKLLHESGTNKGRAGWYTMKEDDIFKLFEKAIAEKDYAKIGAYAMMLRYLTQE